MVSPLYFSVLGRIACITEMRPVCTVVAYSVVYVCLYHTDYLCDGNTGEYCTNGLTDRNAVWGDPGVTFTPPDEYDGSECGDAAAVLSIEKS